MSRVVELTYYSAELDGQARRLSMADSHGGEFYAIVEVGKGGAGYVDRRAAAVQALTHAIAAGWPPGCHGIFAGKVAVDHAKRVDPELGFAAGFADKQADNQGDEQWRRARVKSRS